MCEAAHANHNTYEHVCTDYNKATSHPPDHSDPISNLPPSPRPPTFLETLCHGADDGFLSVAAYIDELLNYMEQCVLNQDKWEANVRAEICNNHNIVYPKRNYSATPRSWN